MRLLLAAFLLLANVASAQFIVCVSTSNGNRIYTDKHERCSKDTRPGQGGFFKQHGFHCDDVQGLPHCTPPPTMSYRISTAPVNLLVKFDGEVRNQGVTFWRWRVVAPVTCTPKDRAYDARICSARAADVAFTTSRFFRTGQDGRGLE